MKRHKNPSVKLIDGLPLEPWSSLNDYVMCVCGRKYIRKDFLIQHLETCSRTPVACPWCTVVFKNKGNLARHAISMHGKSLKNPLVAPPPKAEVIIYKCDVCDASYKEKWKLKFHIRRHHFNLWATIPFADLKRVNEVWYEKVLNTNLIVQITKVGINTLVMKPVPPIAGVEIQEDNRKIIDIQHKYPPFYERSDGQCRICLKKIKKFNLQKHMNETHFNLIKHKCTKCSRTFKRSAVYLHHNCSKTILKNRKDNSVKQYINYSCNNIKISAVASLRPLEID